MPFVLNNIFFLFYFYLLKVFCLKICLRRFLRMNRGKETVKNGIWKISGRKRKQWGGAIPFGLIASFAAPVLGEIVKPIFKKKVGWSLKNRTIYLNQAAPVRKIRRKKQSGQGDGFDGLVKAGFDVGSRALESKIGKK